MKRVRLIAYTSVATALIVAYALAGSASAADTPTPGGSRQVTIVLAPYLTWADISASGTPALYSLATEGAVANTNARSRNRADGGPALDQGAMMLSSGSWSVTAAGVLPAFDASELLGSEESRAVFQRLTQVDPGPAEVLFLGMPRVNRMNAAIESVDALPGALGEAVVSAGGVTAAIGNGDVQDANGVWLRSRRAAVVASDAEGRIRYGSVGAGLIEADSSSPFGVRTDMAAFERELARVSSVLAKRGGPSLLVLDPGDSRRAQLASVDATVPAAIAQRARAIETLDAVVTLAAEALPSDGLLFVVADTVAPVPGEPMGLGPCIAWGAGWRGVIASSSTQRDGLVTNLDITATALDHMGIKSPVQVLGNPTHADGSTTSAEARVAALVRANETAVAIDSAKAGVINVFITYATLLFAIVAAALALSSVLPSRVLSVVRAGGPALLLAAVAVPPASMLMFVVGGGPTKQGSAVAWLLGLTVVLTLAGLAVSRLERVRLPMTVLCLGTSLVILADQWTGASLSFTSFLGYSPLMGARYYGLGNEAAGMLVASALVGLGLLLDASGPDARRYANVAAPLLGMVVVATAAAPMLGANVGVIAWGTVGFALAWVLMTGRRVTWRTVGLVLVLGALLLAAFAAYDLASAAQGTQTHLGRALGSAQSGGLSALWTIVVRKAETNIRVLTRTNWSYLLIVVLALLGYMRWRPQGGFAATLRENPNFSASLAACLLAGLAAFFTEDSGIVIPAVMMLYVGAGTLWLMLGRAHDPAGGDSSTEEGAA